LKSKQTILNWIAWIGTHHPATLLSRAGIKGSGYFQEDEAFEKPNWALEDVSTDINYFNAQLIERC
jgi:hypothetical protein